jgi:phospholipase/carboxylesterase
MTAKLPYIHRFEPGDDPAYPPVLLLHGTGGDEDDLLPLGRLVAPRAALLSPRGNVLEEGMSRFFRRYREGLFDEDDLRRRANELADFVAEARQAYRIAAPFALGYSNGANIAAAMALLRPQTLVGVILLRAMAPFAAPPKPDLSGMPALILSGLSDPIVPAASVERLALALSVAGARVERETVRASHALSQDDVVRAKAFLEREVASQNARHSS